MKTSGLATAAALSPMALANTNKNSRLRVLSVGVVGTIGEKDRKIIASHPMAEITGLCDVDRNYLGQASKDHPDAFVCEDFREAFSKHGDKFDAVIVATPDHSHAAIMLTALNAGKHVYGQKPLVHQLEELTLMENALKAKPDLSTQLGNQRMEMPGRRAFMDIMKSGVMGKAIDVHAWVGSPGGQKYFNTANNFHDPVAPPEHLNWDLWLGPAQAAPYRPELTPRVWRSWWDYGTNGLGDWGCHILDVLFYSFDELVSPMSVITHCAPAGNPAFHPSPVHSTITYAVKSERFKNAWFPIHLSDRAQSPSRAALGLPPGNWPDDNAIALRCEGGIVFLGAGAQLQIWRDGKMTPGLEMPGLPDYPKRNHWHSWVDDCLGREAFVQTPFSQALKMTEASILPIKASRFPGQELLWDKASLTFTNHKEATGQVVKRDYRPGFMPG